MRITGGQARGVPLFAPAGNQTRPAMDRTREAVFSSLGELVREAIFLDLFAGTGAYGLEALSRGAKHGVWVEKDRRAVAIIKKNREAVQKAVGILAPVGQIIVADALRWSPGEIEPPFDLIFVDPPYSLYPGILEPLLAQADKLLRPTSDARLILEGPGDLPLPSGPWKVLRSWRKSARDPAVYCLGRENRI